MDRVIATWQVSSSVKQWCPGLKGGKVPGDCSSGTSSPVLRELMEKTDLDGGRVDQLQAGTRRCALTLSLRLLFPSPELRMRTTTLGTNYPKGTELSVLRLS